ncbi:vitamin D 25-hydroxylase-like protein [Dinothrombium tinctorium]|uniref:Vitamin D 25-hydroxylase-like protein n=1 Tax=Dinothrombium tinctorium TaxID=1965070 RepID=A0A3S3NN30_9ACAR|nr:vitamin D 25-hydroxylase-like protein [Dinothrombium tinctorium]
MVSFYTDVQEKVFEEICSIVGKDRLPCWNDRHYMPYTKAVIKETHRWSSFTPFIFRTARADASILGHFIPKGTNIIANFWAINRDESLWENANEFNPNRFLDADGNEVNKEELIPFSYGKRSCAGETMARIELFLFFTSILQKYRLEIPEDCKFSLDSEVTATLKPMEKLMLRLIPRP